MLGHSSSSDSWSALVTPPRALSLFWDPPPIPGIGHGTLHLRAPSMPDPGYKGFDVLSDTAPHTRTSYQPGLLGIEGYKGRQPLPQHRWSHDFPKESPPWPSYSPLSGAGLWFLALLADGSGNGSAMVSESHLQSQSGNPLPYGEDTSTWLMHQTLALALHLMLSHRGLGQYSGSIGTCVGFPWYWGLPNSSHIWWCLREELLHHPDWHRTPNAAPTLVLRFQQWP